MIACTKFGASMSTARMAREEVLGRSFIGNVPAAWIPNYYNMPSAFSAQEAEHIPVASYGWWMRGAAKSDDSTTVLLFPGGEAFATHEAPDANETGSVGAKNNKYNGRPHELYKIATVLQRVLVAYESRLKPDVFSKFGGRLEVLLHPDNWQISDTLPDVVSFVLMLRFLGHHPEFQSPRVALTSIGQFEISWRAARDKFVSFRFSPDNQISWLLFSPPEPGDTNLSHFSGESSVGRTLEIVILCGAREWMNRAA